MAARPPFAITCCQSRCDPFTSISSAFFLLLLFIFDHKLELAKNNPRINNPFNPNPNTIRNPTTKAANAPEIVNNLAQYPESPLPR